MGDGLPQAWNENEKTDKTKMGGGGGGQGQIAFKAPHDIAGVHSQAPANELHEAMEEFKLTDLPCPSDVLCQLQKRNHPPSPVLGTVAQPLIIICCCIQMCTPLFSI